MNKKITIGILLLTATALIGVPGVLALPGYVGPLQTLYGSSLSCGTCHVNPSGGGTLTAYGTSFSKQANHGTDPTAALTAIGAPPGVTPPPVLTKITVSPATASVVVGGTQTFTAATLDQNGKPITATVTWTSSNTAVGTIDSTGKFTAKAAGTVTITATSGSVKGTATATVTSTTPPSPAPVLTKITVSPATASIAVGGTQTFTAATLDQNGNPITAAVTWTSSNTTIGTIDSTGKFTAKAVGTTTITAASGSVNGTATATVTAVTPPLPGKTVTITFVVIDSETLKPVKEAVVSMDGVKKVTGKTGKVTFASVTTGNHRYTVAGEDYSPVSGQISVAGNTEVSVKLVPVHEDEEHDEDEEHTEGEEHNED
ncbi:MAG: Ig domain-containing protein [Candidatus Methanoperedens sp.]|nr:Ig domain-containing protein [Candidatus Methanoperedens sp.]